MTDDVPELTPRYVLEHRDGLEYILRYGSSLELRAYAEALHIQGISEPGVYQVIDELEQRQEALQIRRVLLRLMEPPGVLEDVRPPFERRCGRFVHLAYVQRLHVLRRRMYDRYHLVREMSRVQERRIRSTLTADPGGGAIA